MVRLMDRARAQSLKTREPSPITRVARPQERPIASTLIEIVIAIRQVEVDLHVAHIGRKKTGAVVDEPVVFWKVVEWVASNAAGSGLEGIVIFVVNVSSFGLENNPGAIRVGDSEVGLG